jgi:hypothetical protein
MVTDAALSRILQDVLALPDIPELESHRLSELCRILNALEGLFVEDPDPNQVGDLCFVRWDYLLTCSSHRLSLLMSRRGSNSRICLSSWWVY